MGANGAGKSTLVKILTGAISANGGRILLRGEERDIRSPASARKAGLVPVYQEPSLIPDLDVLSNLRLTQTPVEPFREWVRELGVPDLDLRDIARDVPLAIQRVLDLARALAVEPDVLLLDEMTAALPANLAERVLDVVRRQGQAGRSVIFISHRFIEISAVCNRATVLRDGETVGVVDVVAGVEERIVELMLGAKVEKQRMAQRKANEASAPSRRQHAHRGPQPQGRHKAPGCLFRPEGRRGGRRRRARRAGAGRAVRRPCRVDQAEQRYDRSRRQGGEVLASG